MSCGFCFACSTSSVRNDSRQDEGITKNSVEHDFTHTPHLNSQYAHVEQKRISEQLKTSQSDRYILSHQENETGGLLDVLALIYDVSDGEEICLPAFGQRAGEKFFLLSIDGADETSINAELNDRGCFIAEKSKFIRFNYQLQLETLDYTRLWIAQTLSSTSNKDWAAYPGESIFIDRIQRKKSVTLEVFSEKSVYATLDQIEPRKFEAKDYFTLTRSYFVFGDLLTIQSSTQRIKLNIHLDQKSSVYGKIINKEITSLLGYYHSIMPKHTPDRVDIFVFSNNHDDQQLDGFARPGGIVFQFGKEAIPQVIERRLLIAHELFHLYNGEQLHFKDDYYQRVSWFLEGMTQYFAVHALLSLGMASQGQYKDYLSKIVNQKVEADRAPDNKGFKPYIDGYFMSWMLYSLMHQQCDASIDGLWSALDSLDSWEQAHSDSWIIQNIDKYCNIKINEQLMKYIVEYKNIPFMKLLANHGFCLKQSNVVKYSLGINYKFDTNKAQYIVTHVYKNSVGEAAGFRSGDYFVPNGSMNWKREEDKMFYRFAENNRQISVKIPVETVIKNQFEVYTCP